jgi:hypothetical protein
MAYFGGSSGGHAAARLNGARGSGRAMGDAFFPTLLGAAARAILPKIARTAGTTAAVGTAVEVARPGTIVRAPPGQVPVAGLGGAVQRVLPGGQTGFVEVGRRRRRTNFANPKALNRAIRRVEGFGRLVQRSKKSVAKANRALNPATRRAAPASTKVFC